MSAVLRFWTNGFVLWVLVFSAAAYLAPGLFTWFKPAIVPGLGIIMFGMGMTLTTYDFVRVARRPRAVLCGMLGQFLIMPFVAFALARVFDLPPELAMGFIILGSCPGGTASNVVSYLAKADVALSVTMTACSTLLAIPLTPVLTGWLGGHFLPVDRWDMFLSVVKMVLVPTSLGLSIRHLCGGRIQKALDVFPAISVLFIVLVIACVVASARDELAHSVRIVGTLVFVHNLAGLTLGYGLAALFRLPVSARRTIAIEVGMQNSGLGVALATKHFTDPLVALPATLFSVMHNLSGSALAARWARRPAPDRPDGLRRVV